jgi:hypothetical protein
MSNNGNEDDRDIIREFAHELYNSCDPALRDDLLRYVRRMSFPRHRKRHERFVRELSECFPAGGCSDTLRRSAEK